MRQSIQVFHVAPKLPSALEPLREMVYNLWWSWEPAARNLFRELDPELWEETYHNPLRVLQLLRQARLEEIAHNKKFLDQLHTTYKAFKAYIDPNRKSTYSHRRSSGNRAPKQPSIAYFSAEFGFHESIPNYSGGLGILAGDHCKSASDLDLNFCAVGLLYRQGYFTQHILKDGSQQAVQLNQNFFHLPITEVCNPANDQPLHIQVEILNMPVFVKIWKLQVGRIPLYLLDTNLPENDSENCAITSQLYGGDHEMRIRQEMILGIGGIRALNALQLQPDVYHLNEGHAAFLGLERIRQLVQEQSLSFRAALQVVAASNIFTTHTPVPAGNDAFSRELIERYFHNYPKEVGIDFQEFFNLGQPNKKEEPLSDSLFGMTILALHTSRHANGVSALHGEVSKGLWEDVWDDIPRNEVPITHITNGIHTKTWAAAEFMELYSKYLGKDWEEHLTDKEYWRRVVDIPADVLWETHQRLKHRLIAFARKRVRVQRERIGEPPTQLREINQLLDPEILTIGFARRFATYKRGNLLFQDPERLLRLVHHPERPVQFVFAGKAHPRDEGGKKMIQEVYQMTRDPRFANRIVFIEDYDTLVGRRLYHGVDLWLNNPLRPLEASGTSGMKLPPSGGLNISVLDGWWCEGYNKKNGWAIGADIIMGSVELQNEVDIESLFTILETQVSPLYYVKPDGKLPIAWIQLMRESIRSIVPVFNTHRMVTEYNEKLYEPSAKAAAELKANACEKATELSQWKDKMRRDWPQVQLSNVQLQHDNHRIPILVGDPLIVSATVTLGSIQPEEVSVQIYYGPMRVNDISAAHIVEMTNAEVLDASKNIYRYEGKIPKSDSGTYGFNVRVIPKHSTLTQEHELPLITWNRS